jgi:DNA-binding CsgD family transcriptional regulator
LALRDLLDQARLGTGQVVFVEGEAGIGKTRLVSELLAVARREGFHVLLGAADERGADRPFGMLVEALGLQASSQDAERRDLAQLIVGEDGERPTSVPASPTADLGFRIVESLLGLVERIAVGGPVVLALEDLHWADPSTLRALSALRRALPQLPVCVIATLRPSPTAGAFDRAMDELARGARHLVLEPLGDEDACALGAAVAGLPPGQDLARRLAPARGNPLYVIELAASVRSDGSEDAAGVLPPTLQQTIRLRLRSLPEQTVEMLEVAAVLGRRFGVTQLCSAMGRSPVALLASLEHAVEAKVLGEEDGDLAFRHELIRDAIYARIPLALRRGLHREVARAISAAGAPPGQVVEHVLAAAEPGDPEARDLLVRAARQCAPQAPREAVKLLERARDLVDPADPAAQALAADLAPLLIQTGRAGEAEALTRDVLARCPLPPVEAALRRALGEVMWTQGWLEASVAELEAAASLSGADETEGVGSLALAGYLRLFLGEPERAGRQAARARTEAARLDDDFSACLACQTLAVGADAAGRVSEAVELAQHAVRIAAHSAKPRLGQLHPQLSLGFILLDADRFEEAEVVLQQGRRGAEDRGTVSWLPLYHCALAMQRVLAGRWDDGLAELESGLTLADEVGTRLYVPFLHGMAAWLALQRGELPVAQARIETATSEFLLTLSASWQADVGERLGAAAARWPLEWGLWIHALLFEATGDVARAQSMLEDAWTVAAPLRYFLGYRIFAPDLVRLAMATGDRRLGEVVVAEVVEGARRSDVAGARAAALRCRGLVDDDPDTLLEAVRAYRSSPRAIELAFALEEAGLSLARRERGGEAVASLEAALDVFESVGAALPLARIEAALRTLGVRRRRAPATQRPTTGWASLTPSELNVARLAAEGLTNRQIGERLFVSRRTVETHLAHAFRKLGLSTRSQLAAEVARRG